MSVGSKAAGTPGASTVYQKFRKLALRGLQVNLVLGDDNFMCFLFKQTYVMFVYTSSREGLSAKSMDCNSGLKLAENEGRLGKECFFAPA